MTKRLADTYLQMIRWPFGLWLFSKVVTLRAPYFNSISPLIVELTNSRCVVFVRKRRRVLNHLGTMHAIAMCNACELAFGLTMEAGLPLHLRWIPKEMQVKYLRKGKTHLQAICDFPAVSDLTTGDYPVPVFVKDANGEIILEAIITVYISLRQ